MRVHFNKKYVATILSYKEVVHIQGGRITTDTKQERAMTVYIVNGRTIKSKDCEAGLYFYDTQKKDNNVEEINNMNENEIIDYSYLQTV